MCQNNSKQNKKKRLRVPSFFSYISILLTLQYGFVHITIVVVIVVVIFIVVGVCLIFSFRSLFSNIVNLMSTLLNSDMWKHFYCTFRHGIVKRIKRSPKYSMTKGRTEQTDMQKEFHRNSIHAFQFRACNKIL